MPRLPARPKVNKAPARPSSALGGAGRGRIVNNTNTANNSATQSSSSADYSTGPPGVPFPRHPIPAGPQGFPGQARPAGPIGYDTRPRLLGREGWERICRRAFASDRGDQGNQGDQDDQGPSVDEDTTKPPKDRRKTRPLGSRSDSSSDSEPDSKKAKTSETSEFPHQHCLALVDALVNRHSPFRGAVPRDQLQQRGSQLSRWIEHPDEPDCKTPRSSLTVHDLKNNLNVSRITSPRIREASAENSLLAPGGPSVDVSNFITWLILQDPRYPPGHLENDPVGSDIGVPRDRFVGSTFPNGIFLHDLIRMNKEFPHVSEIALALFREEYGSLKNLNHIYANEIVNVQTRSYLMAHIYKDHPEEPFHGAHTFKHSTHHYEEILGTPIGQIVGHIMLGGFPRGTHRIANIVCYRSIDLEVRKFHLHLRFDIEPIDIQTDEVPPQGDPHKGDENPFN